MNSHPHRLHLYDDSSIKGLSILASLPCWACVFSSHSYVLLWTFSAVSSFLKNIIYLTVAVPGLHCCMQAFLVAVYRLLIAVASLIAEHGLYSLRALVVAACGLSSWGAQAVAPQYVGSSQTRDRTRVSCIGRQILNPWTTREVLYCELLIQVFHVPSHLSVWMVL